MKTQNTQNTTRYTNAGNMPDESAYDHIIEVAAWADTGTTGYIGVTGQPTLDELRAMLAAEVNEIREWIDNEAIAGVMGERTDEPQVAVVRQRPAADADGDYPPSHEWPVVLSA